MSGGKGQKAVNDVSQLPNFLCKNEVARAVFRTRRKKDAPANPSQMAQEFGIGKVVEWYKTQMPTDKIDRAAEWYCFPEDARGAFEKGAKGDGYFNEFQRCYLDYWKPKFVAGVLNVAMSTDATVDQVVATRLTDVQLEQLRAREEHSYVSEILASVELSMAQSPAGQAWPAIIGLRCGVARIGRFDVGIGRCWVQIDAGPHCELMLDDTKPLDLKSNYGKVVASWVGGVKSRPVCNVVGLADIIGNVEFPQDFCMVNKRLPDVSSG